MHLFSVYDCNYRESRTHSESMIPMPGTPFDDAGLITSPRTAPHGLCICHLVPRVFVSVGHWSDLDHIHGWLCNLPRCDKCLFYVDHFMYSGGTPDVHHLPLQGTGCQHRPVPAIAVACRPDVIY